MMRTRKPKVPVFDEELTGKPETEPEPIAPEDVELDKIFQGFPQHDACLELWRTTEKGGKPSFLGELSPAEFTFGNIMREFGGGRYIVKGKYKDGETIKRSFDIEGDPYPVKRKVPQPSGNPASVSIVQPIAIPRRDDGSVDSMAAMMNIMKTLVTELKSSEDQVLDKMMKYKTLFAPAEKPQQPITEAIGMIKTGIELAQSGSGGGESGGFPWLLALDKLQGPLTELVSTIKLAVTQGRPAQGGPAPVAIQPPVNPSPTNAPPVGAGEKPTMEMIFLVALRNLLPMLVTGAAQQAEPEFYSDLLLDQIPQQYYATAKTFLESPDCVDRLTQLNPAVDFHRPWFELLQKALLLELAPDATGPLQPESTSHAATGSSADL